MMARPLIILAGLTCCLFMGCGEKSESNPVASTSGTSEEAEVNLISETRSLMGTDFTVSVYASNKLAAATAIDNAFEIAEQISQVTSDSDSELSKVNAAPQGQPIKISPILGDLLAESIAAAKLTEGAYDPTLGPLTLLWRQSRRSKSLPDPQTLAAARAACGYQKLTLSDDQSTVTKAVPDMRLDLGGITKGFAVEKMYQTFVYHELPICSIAAGGDLRVGDPPPGEKGWPLKIRHRHGQEQNIIGFQQAAASTSSDLNQSIEIEDKHYAHIIDPATGLGLTRPVSITVFSKSAVLSDSLATALCVLPEEQGKQIAKRFPRIEVHSSYGEKKAEKEAN